MYDLRQRCRSCQVASAVNYVARCSRQCVCVSQATTAHGRNIYTVPYIDLSRITAVFGRSLNFLGHELTDLISLFISCFFCIQYISEFSAMRRFINHFSRSHSYTVCSGIGIILSSVRPSVCLSVCVAMLCGSHCQCRGLKVVPSCS